MHTAYTPSRTNALGSTLSLFLPYWNTHNWQARNSHIWWVKNTLSAWMTHENPSRRFSHCNEDEITSKWNQFRKSINFMKVNLFQWNRRILITKFAFLENAGKLLYVSISHCCWFCCYGVNFDFVRKLVSEFRKREWKSFWKGTNFVRILISSSITHRFPCVPNKIETLKKRAKHSVL